MSCIFCRIVAGEIPAEVVAREPEVTAFLDVQPLADGHVLVVPRAHAACVEDLKPAEADALFRAVVRLAGPVRKALGAAGTTRSEEHTSELQSLRHLVCRLLLEKKKKKIK